MYIITQYGSPSVFLDTVGDVVVHLAGLFGQLDNPAWCDRIFEQVGRMRRYSNLTHEDLSLTIYFGGDNACGGCEDNRRIKNFSSCGDS